MLLGLEVLPFELVNNILVSKAFAVGALYGAFGFLLLGVLAALRRRTTEGGGIALAAATYLAVRDVWGGDIAPLGLALAIVLLAVGGASGKRMRSRMWDRWYVSFVRTAVALLPGALVLGLTFPLSTPGWLRVAAPVGAVLTGVLVCDFDLEQGPRGAPFALLFVSALGIYYTVPDTELPLVLLGASVPFAIVSFPQPLRRLGAAGSAAMCGIVAWVVVVGGQGRPGSVVAGFGTLGLLLVEPLGRRIPRSRLVNRKWDPPRLHSENWLAVTLVAGLVQLTLCAYCATMAGRENEALAAALMVLPAMILLGALAPTVLPLRPKASALPARRGSPLRSRVPGATHRTR